MRTQKRKELPSVVLLTDDAENRRRAEQEGVPCFSGESLAVASYDTTDAVSVHSYVSGAKDPIKLLDIVASAEDNVLDATGAPAARRPALYPDV